MWESEKDLLNAANFFLRRRSALTNVVISPAYPLVERGSSSIIIAFAFRGNSKRHLLVWRVRAPGNGSHGLRVAFDPLAALLHRWISKPPLKPERAEVGLTVVIVLSSMGSRAVSEIYDSSNARRLAGHRRDFSLLENPESAPTLSIRFLISNFQWPTGEMWVTRQMAAHTGQHLRRRS